MGVRQYLKDKGQPEYLFWDKHRPGLLSQKPLSIITEIGLAMIQISEKTLNRTIIFQLSIFVLDTGPAKTILSDINAW